LTNDHRGKRTRAFAIISPKFFRIFNLKEPESYMRDFMTIDSLKFPVVVCKYHNFVPTQEEFLKAQRDCEEFYADHLNFVVIVDLSDLPALPNEYRISQAKWSQRNKPLVTKQQITFSFYTPSLALQLLMKTVFAISTPGVPYAVCATLEKAHAWAQKQIAMNRKTSV
jgi:hypothetical protein